MNELFEHIEGSTTSTHSDHAAVNEVKGKFSEVLNRDILDPSCYGHLLDSMPIGQGEITKTFED